MEGEKPTELKAESVAFTYEEDPTTMYTGATPVLTEALTSNEPTGIANAKQIIIPRLPSEPIVDNIADITDEEILMTQAIAELNTEARPLLEQWAPSAVDMFLNKMQGKPYDAPQPTAQTTWDGGNDDMEFTTANDSTLNANDDIIDISRYQSRPHDTMGNVGRNLQYGSHQQSFNYQASTDGYVPMHKQPAYTVGGNSATKRPGIHPPKPSFNPISGYTNQRANDSRGRRNDKYMDDSDDDGTSGLTEAVDVLHDKIDEVYDTVKCADKTCTEITEMLASIGDINEDINKDVKIQYEYLIKIAQNDAAVKNAVGTQLGVIQSELATIKAEQNAQRGLLEQIMLKLGI